MAGEEFYAAAERRIELFAVLLGLAGGVCAGIFWNMRAGAGVILGAGLSWINFRWIREAVGVLARLSTAQQGTAKPRVPASIYFKFAGRYALIVAGAYVILRYLNLPIATLLAGFGVVGVAALAEVVFQLFRSTEIPHTNS